MDYLWGQSANAIIAAIAKAVDDGRPVRFVHVGSSGGEETIELAGAALRSSAILLMGSGLKSVPLPVLLQAIKSVFEVAQTARLEIATRMTPLTEVEKVWKTAGGKPRVVFTVE